MRLVVLVSRLQPSCANQDSEKRISRLKGVPIEDHRSYSANGLHA
jgi:hypothetical protein